MAALYKTYLVGNRQSVIDFSMQRYGCPEGVAQLMADNPVITSPTQYLAPGTPLRVLTTVPQLNDVNVAVLAQYTQAGTQVATGIQEAIDFSDFSIH